jgi:hypothetical protein
MSNSPVELFDGCLLNHTNGLSLFATSDPEELFDADFPLSDPPPHAVTDSAITAAIVIKAIFLFIHFLPSALFRTDIFC